VTYMPNCRRAMPPHVITCTGLPSVPVSFKKDRRPNAANVRVANERERALAVAHARQVTVGERGAGGMDSSHHDL